MIRQEYLDYAAGFTKLNPFELHHMCEKIHVQIEKMLFNKNESSPETVQLSIPELKDVITKGMKLIYVELANQKKFEFDLQLEQAKMMAFASEEISDDEVYEHLEKCNKENKIRKIKSRGSKIAFW